MVKKNSLFNKYHASWREKNTFSGQGIHHLGSMWTLFSPCEVHWQTRNQGMWNTRQKGEKKRELIESRGGGGSLNPFFSPPFFPVVKDADQGLPLDAGFTSLPSVWLWRSNNATCAGRGKKCVYMSSFKEKIWVCRAPLEVSTLSECRIPGIPGH